MNKFIADKILEDKLGIQDIYDQASDVYAAVVERFIKLLGSEGKGVEQ